MKKQIGIKMGIMADPFSTQLKAQGFKFDKNKVKHCEELKEHMFHLRMNGLLNDSQIKSIEKKLFNKIVNACTA